MSWASPNESARGVRKLLGFIRANEQLARAISAHCGIGLHDLNALIHLSEAGRLTAGELARRMDLPNSRLTPLIDRLEQASLAVRIRDSYDRRRVHVSLTEDGATVVAWSQLQWQAAFETLSASRLAVLTSHLSELTASVMHHASTVSTCGLHEDRASRSRDESSDGVAR